jgi:DNA-binding LytR/AlgR family response regulator
MERAARADGVSSQATSVEAPRLRALLVEDEWPARNHLADLLEASGLARVVGAVSDESAAREALQDSSQLGVDVCADVALGGPNGDRAGLRLARSLAGVAGGPAFVLATALDRHGVEAYEAGVVDYLLKPFGEERVARCVRRVLERRPVPSSPAHNHRIVARRRRSLVFLEPGEIWAFEASERLTFVHTVHGRFDLDLSLAAIERAFGTFARVHRSWLVNVAHVKELEREDADTQLFVGSGLDATSPGIRVPVSRERSHAVRGLLLSGTTGVRRS